MRVQCALCPEWNATAEDAEAARQVFADHRFQVHGIPPPARSDFAVCEECGWMAEVFGHPRQRPHRVREVLAAHVCPNKPENGYGAPERPAASRRGHRAP